MVLILVYILALNFKKCNANIKEKNVIPVNIEEMFK